MYAFELKRPTSLSEAKDLIGAGGQPLSGGQTLIPTLKARLADPGTLVSLTGIAELKGVCRDDDGRICIGGATSHGAAAEALEKEYPGLASLASRIGDPAVRNRGTIGGSLANNDPSACWPAGALGSGATIITDRREIAADDYFVSMFETALEEGEIVTEVRFPVPKSASYEKFIQPASHFPLVASFVARFEDRVRVAITGASESGVFRWSEAEQALSENFSADALADLSHAADGMISDLHGTPAYRAHLVKVMTQRAVSRIA